jgi:hypothetical protein
MRPLNGATNKRRRSLTSRVHSTPLADQKGNLAPLHLQILQWVETCQPGETRPTLDGLSGFTIDAAVAELVGAGLIQAVAVPPTSSDRAHWLPTGLTSQGSRTLLHHRRTQPHTLTHSSWRLRIWG